MASTYSTVDPILWAAASSGSCAPGFVLLHACRSPVREVRDARRAGLSQRGSTAGLADGDEQVSRPELAQALLPCVGAGVRAKVRTGLAGSKHPRTSRRPRTARTN